MWASTRATSSRSASLSRLQSSIPSSKRTGKAPSKRNHGSSSTHIRLPSTTPLTATASTTAASSAPSGFALESDICALLLFRIFHAGFAYGPFSPGPACLFRSRSRPPPQGAIALASPAADGSRPSRRPRIGRPRTRHSSGDVKRLQYSRGTASSLPLAFEIIAETMATTSLGSIPIGTGCPPSPMTHSS